MASTLDLRRYCQRVFRPLPRVDQRRWAHTYVKALLATPGKKSIQRLARSVSSSPAAAQSLRQFVNASPWSWEPIQRELTTWVREAGPVNAWTFGPAFLPKRGERSVGVHRRYDPFANRTANCQVGYGAFLAVGSAHVPVAWELSLPGPWDDCPNLRQRARVPATERHRPPWVHVLNLVETLAARTDPAPVVTDLSDSHDSHDACLLAHGLAKRGHTFVIAMPRQLPVTVEDQDGSCQQLAQVAPVGTGDPATQPFAPAASIPRPCATRVRSAPARVPMPRADIPQDRPYQLFTTIRPDNRVGQVWLTNLPQESLPEAARLAQQAGGPATAIAAMARWFGLLDFEGRSFPGWHHHMSLISAAYAYGRLG
ncbi:IS701 family transposase [Streptomyces rubiginosohelvolus]